MTCNRAGEGAPSIQDGRAGRTVEAARRRLGSRGRRLFAAQLTVRRAVGPAAKVSKAGMTNLIDSHAATITGDEENNAMGEFWTSVKAFYGADAK